MSARDWFWIFLLGTVWGCSFIFNAVLLEEIGPLWVSAFRVGIGAIGCWIVLVAMRKPLPRSPILWMQLGALGLISYTIPFALYPLSQTALASGVAAIINALTPIMTVLVSHVWAGGERANRTKMAGVAAGFAGAVILALPALAEGGDSRLWAIGACILATICYAVALNVTRSFAKVEPSTLATVALTGGALAVIPVAYAVEGVPVITQWDTVAAIVAIGLISTTFAYQIMYRLLPRIGATNFSIVTFIAPISAIGLGVALLGEHIELAHIIGMLGIFIGLLLIDGRAIARLRRKLAIGA